MPFTTFWSPNQAAIAQVETYTFSAPSGVGNWYTATINGKSITYVSVSGDTAATAATSLLALLNLSTSISPELKEITFANPSSGVLTATARVPGTPFANVTVNGVANQGLTLTTGNGLVNGIATAHTTPNQSPSDIYDAQNWSRVNTGTNPPSQTRSLPQNADNVVVGRSTVPMLWNLDRLANVQFGTYSRWSSMTGQIGLPSYNAAGYTEWRAPYLQFLGPQGSVPAGGLTLVVGYSDGNGGGGPQFERYNLTSQQVTLNVLAANRVDFLGIHTNNTFTAMGGAILNVATTPGEVATLSSSTADTGATVNVGVGVTWTAASTLTVNGGTAVLNSAPATLTMSNGAQVTITTDALTWPAITAQGGCSLTFLAGGTVTALNMSQGCTLDKSQDLRALTLTNSTLDGDTCQILDPLGCIVFTNATTVKQQVTSGPFVFTGTRTVKVT